ncbi:MAG: VOC family protein [Gammaproteobacteria bacterium]|nr:VOC family protein [Gammaproteobacteria bacterium]
MRIERIDHLVLTVKHLAVTCEFYRTVLGMEVITFGNGRTALRFGDQKINLHVAGAELEPKAEHPTPGSADLCFITAAPLEAVMNHWAALGVKSLGGPMERTGALGPMRSVYCRDPDRNLIEVSNYSMEP